MWNNDKKIQEEVNLASSISVFADGLKLEGDVESLGDVRVDGYILGNVSSQRKVMIGEKGKITGNIKAQEVYVMGVMTGDIVVEGLAKIGSTGKYKGNIVSAAIEIESGAEVEGTLSKTGSLQKEGEKYLKKVK